MELLNSTPESHPDKVPLTSAVIAVKEINVNINEYKRRKDLGKKRRACWEGGMRLEMSSFKELVTSPEWTRQRVGRGLGWRNGSRIRGKCDMKKQSSSDNKSTAMEYWKLGVCGKA